MICPCCKRPLESGIDIGTEAILNGLRLGPVSWALARTLAAHRGVWFGVWDLVSAVYGGPNGGPDGADYSIDVTFHHLKKKLAPYGLKLEGRRGPGGGRRMAP